MRWPKRDGVVTTWMWKVKKSCVGLDKRHVLTKQRTTSYWKIDDVPIVGKNSKFLVVFPIPRTLLPPPLSQPYPPHTVAKPRLFHTSASIPTRLSSLASATAKAGRSRSSTLGTAMHRRRPAFAAMTPFKESSMATQR